MGRSEDSNGYFSTISNEQFGEVHDRAIRPNSLVDAMRVRGMAVLENLSILIYDLRHFGKTKCGSSGRVQCLGQGQAHTANSTEILSDRDDKASKLDFDSWYEMGE